jgi:DNA sulfur modification protein DndC
MQSLAPIEMGHIEIISLEQLEEIRRIWVVEKYEVEDYVPLIWEEVYQSPYPGMPGHTASWQVLTIPCEANA